MHEVQPWNGSYISIGQFELLRDMKIIDFSHVNGNHKVYFHKPAPEDWEKAVWSDIDRAFSTPVRHNDNSTIDYVPTQIIAELFKREGIDGIAYRSNFGEDGHNIVLFDIAAAELTNCGLCQVDAIEMTFSQADRFYFACRQG